MSEKDKLKTNNEKITIDDYYYYYLLKCEDILKEIEKDIDNKITFCTNEAEGTTNDKICRITIVFLEHLKYKIKELKGE